MHSVDFWRTSSPDIVFRDYGPDVSINISAFPYDGDVGIYCREQDSKQKFCLFYIAPWNNAYGILYYDNGNWDILSQGVLTQVTDRYDATAECIGDVLRFYVNGEDAIVVTDTRLVNAGELGLYVYSAEQNGSWVAYDYFEVYGYP